MAAVSIPPSPHAIGNMAGRRAPLSTLPNAGNSPFRPTVQPKYLGPQSRTGNEVPYGQPPPAKKHIVEAEVPIPRTPPRRITHTTDGRGANKRLESNLDKKLQTNRDRLINGRITKPEKAEAELEGIRQWQKHYRRAFPSYVFFFESVPEDQRRQFSKAIAALGAREEKFFSRDVTHVVTARKQLTENDSNGSNDNINSGTTAAQQETSNTGTINPLLLEKSASQNPSVPRGKFNFENTLGTRLSNVSHDVESRRQPAGRVDILQRAKELGIKTWQLDKFNRILAVIFDENQSQHGHNTRNMNPTISQAAKTIKQTDLSQMIKNEQLNGPSDRETKLTTDLVMFKGPYIYIRCMNEKHKPTMVREYPRVQRREDGEWPQFRSACMGKCPFIEEDTSSKRADKGAKNARAKDVDATTKARKVVKNPAPRARGVAPQPVQMQPPPQAGRKRPLAEMDAGTNAIIQLAQQLPPPGAVDPRFSKSFGNMSGIPAGLLGREPMASGIQASNITSAIRSQMLSSTAAAPGAKAGTSKEIHGLQRKVLERNSGPSLTGLATSGRTTGVAAPARTNTRLAKQRAQEKLGHPLVHIDEENMTPSEQEEAEQKAAAQSKRSASKTAKGEKKDPKPGYCENCREKFEDFEEHTFSRKHRKFATTRENWKELDYLLSTLTRPILDDYVS